ncbi:unnamed protein product, partial [Rotaria magnacalcarata]
MEDEIFMQRHENDQQQRQRERNRSNNYQSSNKRFKSATDRNRPVPVWTSSSQVQLGSYTNNKSQATEKCDYNEEED